MFVNSNGPTHVEGRDSRTTRRIRQHVMYDIAKTWRKPHRNPQVQLALTGDHKEAEAAVTQLNNPHRVVHRQVSLQCPEATNHIVMAGPIWDYHPLAIINRGCGEDAFAAYGLALVTYKGENHESKLEISVITHQLASRLT